MSANSPWLTTVDNVWNPFTQFDAWLAFDLSNEHCSNQVLAKFARMSDELSEEENRTEVEAAIKNIVLIDPEHMYCIVYEYTFEEDLKKAKEEHERIVNALTEVKED